MCSIVHLDLTVYKSGYRNVQQQVNGREKIVVLSTEKYHAAIGKEKILLIAAFWMGLDLFSKINQEEKDKYQMISTYGIWKDKAREELVSTNDEHLALDYKTQFMKQ